VADEWDVVRKEWKLECIRMSEGETCLCGKTPISEVCSILRRYVRLIR